MLICKFAGQHGPLGLGARGRPFALSLPSEAVAVLQRASRKVSSIIPASIFPNAFFQVHPNRWHVQLDPCEHLLPGGHRGDVLDGGVRNRSDDYAAKYGH